MPVIIEGGSVVLNRKTFSAAEIGRLKTKNSNNNDTTYSIFESIDSQTKSCSLTMGTTTTVLPFSSYNFPGTWTGQLKDGAPQGQGEFAINIEGTSLSFYTNC